MLELWVLVQLCVHVLLILFAARVLLAAVRGGAASAVKARPAPKFYGRAWPMGLMGPPEMKAPIPFLRERFKAVRAEGAVAFTTYIGGTPTVFVTGKQDVEALLRQTPSTMSFVKAYRLLIRSAFDYGILDEDHVAARQIDLLARFMTNSFINSYLAPSSALALDIIKGFLVSKKPGEATSDTVEANLEEVIRKTGFTVGARNMHGNKIVALMDYYPLKYTITSLAVASSAILAFVPGYSYARSLLKRIMPYSDPFDVALWALVLEIEKDLIKSGRAPANVLEDMIAQRRSPSGPTQGNPHTLAMFAKFVVFGAGLNGYSMMVSFVRKYAHDSAAWSELRAEQAFLDEKYGAETVSKEKLNSMEKLKKLLKVAIVENNFPVLLRIAESDFDLSDGTTIPEGYRVGLSPLIEYENGVDVTFGFGEHRCTAEVYTQLMMTLILSTLIKSIVSFKVLSSPPRAEAPLVTFAEEPEIRGIVTLDKAYLDAQHRVSNKPAQQ